MTKLFWADYFVIGLALTLGVTMLSSESAAEWLALTLIIIAGIPHGSFDLRTAHSWWGDSLSRRITLIIAYVLVGLSMSTLCLAWPGFGLCLFLVISAFHFAEGERLSNPGSTGTCIGIGAILLPISFHLPQAAQYLQFFASQDSLIAVKPYLVISGWAICCILCGSLILDFFNGRRADLLQRTVCLLGWVVLPPLSGFCVWFIGRHSRQHLQRSGTLFSKTSARTLPADFIVLSILAIALILPLAYWFDLRDIHQLFAASIVLIAGLTLPHMVVTHMSEREKRRGVSQSRT
jgi:Brp/Blh family beta-carotene 15,15'-monooxygenase